MSEKKLSVLITGGSGLVGRYLTSLLLSEGYKVTHLSRKQDQFGKVRVFRWDPEKMYIDPVVFDETDYIIHLAGANIGEKRWSKKRKEEIIRSRIESARLIHMVLKENAIPLKAFISASATGYYGSVTGDRIFDEDCLPADDFLGTTCRLWEEAADMIGGLGIRCVKIRSGVVLEKNNNPLSALLMLARAGIFPVMGSGRQYMPWIHIEDLCRIYAKVLMDDTTKGAYNAVSPYHVTQYDLMKTLVGLMNRPFIHPPVPSLFLKIAMGEMAEIILTGSRISSEKILNTGFRFAHENLTDALNEIAGKEE